ncbi:MAG: transporter, family, multidrug resistance protein, partial [Alphaproteobacteria bacterium]|nr:transporter, family, multidrug resistance protein [Alphaproteobacteria bacterium]
AVHLFMPVIPAVKADLALSDALAQFTFSIALFGMALAPLVYGSLSDRYGRRPLLLSGLSIFLVGSLISSMADSVTALIAGRLAQAIGAGCGVTLVRTIAADVYGSSGLVKALAYVTMFYTLGPMISPMVGGLLIDILGWRSVFAFALLLGAIISAGAYFAIFESRPPGLVVRSSGNVLRSYVALLAQVRFTGFVLQTGFCTGTFLTAATAAASLMKELLDRPATEFGFYFVLFPIGFLLGNLISSRLGARVANETMVLAGSIMCLAAVLAQCGLFLSGHVTPLAFFVPGFFITLAQGISLPYSQAGAMMTNPQLAGTAAGIGVFVQNFCGAAFAQIYGLLADGTLVPLMITMSASALLGLVAGAVPFALARMRLKDA